LPGGVDRGTSKTVDYVMVARLKLDHKPWRTFKGKGWLACEDPMWKDWETYFEEGGEQCPDQKELRLRVCPSPH
jgi:hypothetical protein